MLPLIVSGNTTSFQDESEPVTSVSNNPSNKRGDSMTRPTSQSYPPHHPYYGRPLIEVTDHDVLCGRGVNISQHPGNERFRALVNTRQDSS